MGTQKREAPGMPGASFDPQARASEGSLIPSTRAGSGIWWPRRRKSGSALRMPAGTLKSVVKLRGKVVTILGAGNKKAG